MQWTANFVSTVLNDSHIMPIHFMRILCLYMLTLSGQQAFSQTDTIAIQVDSHVIYAQWYAAREIDEAPFLLLLHGFPGGFGDVLGIAQALSDSVHVATLTLSGVPISEGVYQDSSPVVDIRAAMEHFMSEEFIRNYRIDPAKIYIGGWSFGGGLAMYMGAEDPRIKGIISVAGWNGRAFLKQIEEDERIKMMMLGVFVGYKMQGRARFDPSKALDYLVQNVHIFDPVANAARISQKPLLVVGGNRDIEVSIEEHIRPYVQAIEEASGDVTYLELDTDHRFYGQRKKLHEVIKEWMRTK